MRWSSQQVATAVGGRLLFDATPEATFDQVTIDSRKAASGGLFVPLRAQRDGHDFIAAALAQGSSGYLVASDHGGGRSPAPNVAAIEVADTAAALLDLGREARRRLPGAVVGITGSVGKTSTKDLTAAVLGTTYRVTANERSFNNELGVPLTLANAADGTEVTVVEMGARGFGHIALLCEVAHPTVAVVTVVARAHTDAFGDLAAVAVAKGELVEALPPNGAAVLNVDDPLVAAMTSRTDARILRYSAQGQRSADVIAETVRLDNELRASFTLRSPWGQGEVQLTARGRHQVTNALAAIAVGLDAGVPLPDACEAVGRASLSPWRMELARSREGAWVLNDAYNANPASMTAALHALADLPAIRRVAVLGEMAELGPDTAAEHARVSALAASLGVRVIAVGTGWYGGEPVAGIEEAIAAVGALDTHDAVLVKASRVAGLERLAARLIAGGPADIDRSPRHRS